MGSILESLAHPTAGAFVVLAFALVVLVGGVVAVVQSFRKPTYDAAIAYGVGGMFACVFLFAVGNMAYVLDMGLAQQTIMKAPVAARAAILASAERSAMASIYVAFGGVLGALPMATYLFIRALMLRKKTPDAESAQGVRPPSVGRPGSFGPAESH